MSILFHSINGDVAKIAGSERFYMMNLIPEILVSVLKTTTSRPNEILGPVTNRGYWDKDWKNMETALKVPMSDLKFIIEGQEIDPINIALNTALAVGGDPLKLLARIHGQCEMNCFVRGENRKWLADIIQRGRSTNLFRSGKGWELVADLLLQEFANPIVLSYSICMEFPSRDAADWEDDCDGDEWYDLPTAKQWELAFEKISSPELQLELSPDSWNDYKFIGCSAFDILDLMNQTNTTTK